VVDPSEVALKRTMSESSVVPAIPGTEPGASNESRRLMGAIQEKASMRNAAIPTSEPSKARLKLVPSKKRTSSFSAAIPPTVTASRSEK
jgi:hypothetical protein